MQSSNELQLEDVFEAERPVSGTQIDKKLVWLRKGSLALLDQGLVSGSNFLVSILLARWLTRDQYGAYAMGFSIFIFLYGFQNAFLLEPMSVFGPESYSGLSPHTSGNYSGFHFVLAFGLAVAVVVGIIFLPFFTADRALTSAMWGVCVAIPLILFYWICRRATY